MISFLKKLFKAKDYKSLMAQGARVIDVRSVAEYKNGHIKGSENIPLHSIEQEVKKIAAFNSPIILCCASGMRSANATSLLKSAGINAHNGGGWASLKSKI